MASMSDKSDAARGIQFLTQFCTPWSRTIGLPITSALPVSPPPYEVSPPPSDKSIDEPSPLNILMLTGESLARGQVVRNTWHNQVLMQGLAWPEFSTAQQDALCDARVNYRCA